MFGLQDLLSPRSDRGVVRVALLVTCGLTVLAVMMNFILYPPELLRANIIGTAIITPLLAFPTTYMMGRLVLRNYTLSQELSLLAGRDALTGLSNRRHFLETLHRQDDALGVVLMVDIDHFKRVNDTHGHFAGDEVIKTVGHILKSETRADDIVSRFGGEEYAVFLTRADTRTAQDIAERIRTTVEAAVWEGSGITISVTISIGGSNKRAADRVEASLEAADRALYQAKRAGRNTTVFAWTSTEASPISTALTQV